MGASCIPSLAGCHLPTGATCTQANGKVVSQFISTLRTSGGRRSSAEYSDQIDQIPEYRAARECALQYETLRNVNR
jgi:hypothetical protein